MSDQSTPKKLLTRVVDQLFDPDNIKSSIMVLGLLAVVAVLFGIFQDGGKFLVLLKDSEVSRGLITFLVALTTVLLALILAIYAITSNDKDTIKERFSLGKDILATLVGILGTVLGFYFGSAEKTSLTPLAVAEINFRGKQLMSHAFGGTAPYRYSITSPNQQFSKIEARISKDGWILETLNKQPQPGTPITVTVSDAKDKTVSSTANVPTEQPSNVPSQIPTRSASPSQPSTVKP